MVGDDFDKKIVDYLAEEFKRYEGIELRNDRQALQRLTEAAEKAKIELSSVTQAEINLPFITATQDGPKHLGVILTRAKFEELCADLFERCRIPVENAVMDDKLSNTNQELDRKQIDTLMYFDKISREYTQVELEADTKQEQEKQRAADDFHRKKEELNSQSHYVSSQASSAKSKLSLYFKSVVNDTREVSTIVVRRSQVVNGLYNNPRSALKSYRNEADNLLSQIDSLSKEPTAVGCIAGIIFVAGWIILGITFRSLSGGFWLASISAGLTAVLIYSTRNSQRQQPYSQLLKLAWDAEILCKEGVEEVKGEYQQQLKRIEDDYENSVETAKRAFETKMATVYRAIKEYKGTIESFSPRWDDERWDNWVVAISPPEVTRLGEITTLLGGDDVDYLRDYQFSVSTLLRFPSKVGTLFKVSGSGKNLVAQRIQSLLLRLVATIPPGKLRFTFIDPVGLGQNVAPFIHLADYDETLVTAKAWSEPRHIEQRLGELTEHLENVIQKYLRNTYATIEEFNEQAGEVAEPYRFLIVMNFPVNFSEDAARRLVSILQNGPRCGVYSIILYDAEQKLPYGFNIDDITRFTRKYQWDGKRLIWAMEKSFRCVLELDQPPAEEVFGRIINQVGKAAIEAMKVEVPFIKILEKAELTLEHWWTGSTSNGIRVPLGPIGANKVQYLEFGKGTAQHALIAGKTGSGKSTLLHVFISTLALNYSPDEVQLYLIDFKKGVEFKTYATHQLPHASVIAIESEREFGLSVLQGLDAELKRRGDLFRKAEVDGLKEYRQKTEQTLPRIILLVDEFQEFFTEDDPVASKASQILDRLVRQGRAFGIHMLLGSQTLAGANTLARSTIDQMAIRIALQCSEADSRLILSDDNPAARLLSRPGEAIYNSANGLIEGNQPFQVAWLPDEQHDEYLDKINALAEKQGLFPPKGQIVFEGNAPADAAHNQALNEFLIAPQWSVSLKRISAWLGEPIAIKDATTAHFQLQSGSNLAIIGQDDESAKGMIMISTLTLSAQHKPESATFYLLDFGSVDDPHGEFLKLLPDVLPHTVHYGKRRQLPEFIAAISQEVEQRLAHDEESLQGKPTIYLIVYGLHRARDLEQDDSFGGGLSFDDTPKPPDPSKQFPKILKEGPDLGVHTIIWCDTNTNLSRRLNRQALKEFEMRVVFQMSNDDSMNLIDSPTAGKLGQHRALFYSEQEGILEKFRPFALPSEEWIKHIGETFKKYQKKS